MIDPGDIPQRVERGAQVLDLHVPGWELKIDAENLEMSSCARCVLGQTFGGYVRGLEVLIGPEGVENEDFDEKLDIWPELHGFEALGSYYTGFSCEEEYEALQAAWVDLVKDRLDRGVEL